MPFSSSRCLLLAFLLHSCCHALTYNPRERWSRSLLSRKLLAAPSPALAPAPTPEAPAPEPEAEGPSDPDSADPKFGFCPSLVEGVDDSLDPPRSAVLFNVLSVNEIQAASDFVVRSLALFNGSVDPNANMKLTDDYLFDVELLEPPKAAALAYLDQGAPPPPRYALALVMRPSKGDIMKYRAGPLVDEKIAPGATLLPLTAPGSISISHRPEDMPEAVEMQILIQKTADELEPLFRNITGGACYNSYYNPVEGSKCPLNSIDWLPYPFSVPYPNQRNTVIVWNYYPRQQGGTESELHPLPIAWKINHTSLDVAKWFPYDFEYCNQGPFPSARSLLSALQTGKARWCEQPKWFQAQKNGLYNDTWAWTDEASTTENIRPNSSDLPGPHTFMPYGRRFEIGGVGDSIFGGFRISWQGWDFHTVLKDRTGLALYDVQFLGGRIAYELSLQDQVVIYSGYGLKGQQVYLDSLFRLGAAAGSLKRGVDCPEHAAYFYSTTRVGGQDQIAGLPRGGVVPDSICVFEYDAQETEWVHRHYPYQGGYRHDSRKRTSLVVRSMSTLSNYDYIYDIHLNLDGSIRVGFTAAGYMVTTFWSESDGATRKEKPFGTRVAQHSFALLHDHMALWKVDLDVKGTNNSFMVSEVKAGTYEEALGTLEPPTPPPAVQATDGGPASVPADPKPAPDPPLAPPPWSAFNYVKYVEHSFPPLETAYRLNLSAPKVFKIVNEAQRGPWGQPKGYAIAPEVSELQLLDSRDPILRGLSWTKHSLAVTQRKDSEPYASEAQLDAYQLPFPVVSLDSYINGESIQNQDLTAWVNIGFLHIPRTEDVPLISNIRASFVIKPVNYFDRLASINLPAAEQAFYTCAPREGVLQFNYTWADEESGNPGPEEPGFGGGAAEAPTGMAGAGGGAAEAPASGPPGAVGASNPSARAAAPNAAAAAPAPEIEGVVVTSEDIAPRLIAGGGAGAAGLGVIGGAAGAAPAPESEGSEPRVQSLAGAGRG